MAHMTTRTHYGVRESLQYPMPDGMLCGTEGRMKTISIISQKGGAGKTTLAINLAGAAVEHGLSVMIIDLDPQTSAKKWHDDRANKEAPAVISAHAERLPEILKAATDSGADLCIIDTAPHSSNEAMTAAESADLILIPCRASTFDLNAIAASIKITRLAGKKGMIVLNGLPPGSITAAKQAEEGITATYKMPVMGRRISQRAAFVHSVTDGKTVIEHEPDGAAAAEIKALFAAVCGQLEIVCRNVGMRA